MRHLLGIVLAFACAATLVGSSALAAGPVVVRVAHDDSFGPIATLDPAYVQFQANAPLTHETCLTLLRYSEAPGPASVELVAEAAAEMPVVSGGGMTHTFTLRPGLMYADGSSIDADDFVRGIDRAKASSVGFIVSALQGVTATAPTASTVAVSATSARGDIPALMAYSNLCPAPDGTPIGTDLGFSPPKASGAYAVAAGASASFVALDRNTYYTGSRDVRNDRIEFSAVSSGTASTTVDNGTKDVTSSVTGTDLSGPLDLDGRFGPASTAAAQGDQRLFAEASGTVNYLAVNTSRVTDGRVRRAISHILDRNALLTATNAVDPLHGVAWSRYLAPVFPDVNPAGFYGLSANLAAAAAELAGIPTPIPVTLYRRSGALTNALETSVKTQLEATGWFAVNLVPAPPAIAFGGTEFFNRLATPGEPWDLAIVGFSPAYLDPAGLLGFILPSSQIPTGPGTGSNVARFNDAGTDAALAAAAPTTPPGRYGTYDSLAAGVEQNHAPYIALSYRYRKAYFGAAFGCESFNPYFGLILGAVCMPQEATVPDDGTFTGGDPASAEATIESPNGGTVSVYAGDTVTPRPDGYSLLGTEFRIEAPDASAADPLRLTFHIDASEVPAGESASTIVVLRDGQPVADCPGSTTASPDPCVTSRADLTGGDDEGDIELVVLTSHASLWAFAVEVPSAVVNGNIVLPLETTRDKGQPAYTLLGSVSGRDDVAEGSLAVTYKAAKKTCTFTPLPNSTVVATATSLELVDWSSSCGGLASLVLQGASQSAPRGAVTVDADGSTYDIALPGPVPLDGGSIVIS